MADRKPIAIELGWAQQASPFGKVLDLFIPGQEPIESMCPYCIAHDVGLAWWRFLGGTRRLSGAELHQLFGEHVRDHGTGRVSPRRAMLLDALVHGQTLGRTDG